MLSSVIIGEYILLENIFLFFNFKYRITCLLQSSQFWRNLPYFQCSVSCSFFNFWNILHSLLIINTNKILSYHMQEKNRVETNYPVLKLAPTYLPHIWFVPFCYQNSLKSVSTYLLLLNVVIKTSMFHLNRLFE
jgi:hypothetical protein